MYLRFRFVSFWRKEISAKAACKMLVKLTPGKSLFEKHWSITSMQFFWTISIYIVSPCCPVLSPQMTGDALFPGDWKENVSETQSPIAPPSEKN